MIPFEMTDIRRHFTGRNKVGPKGAHIYLLVPGGWTAQVPEVTGEPQILDAYKRYFIQDGNSSQMAAELARETVQETYRHGFIDGLRDSIWAHAREYAVMYPELRQRSELSSRGGNVEITMRGFDPEVMQSAYVPFQRPGRAGLGFVKDMLRRMAREVR